MANNKITRSRRRKKVAPYRRVLRFPQAKGKIIADVELDVSSDYYIIEIKFQDKTALSLDLEPCVAVYPELTNWKTGNYRLLKRWQSVHSKSSRI